MKVLISQEQISQKVEEIASSIKQYYGDEPFNVIGVLNGCFMFLADLVRHFENDVKIDFISSSSYGESMSPEQKPLLKVPDHINLNDKKVLIIEDILDTGNTLSYLTSYLQTLGPKEIKTCVLVDKPSRREVPYTADWLGFSIEDHFIVGYGLDYQGRYRQLPYIGIINPNET